MHVREKGSRVQLLRTKYVPVEHDERGNIVRGTGRSKARLVATFDRSLDALPADVAEQLSKQEQAKVQDWLDQRAVKQARASLERDIQTLPEIMLRVAEAVGKGSAYILEDQAEAINQGMKALKRAIRKAMRDA